MTTPTREQVVQWAYLHGEVCYKSNADDQSYGMWCPANLTDKEIATLLVDSLNARADLEAIISEEAKDSGNVILELTALQSKSAALVDALETVANWLVCAPIASAEDMAQSFFPIFKLCEEALASFKGSK